MVEITEKAREKIIGLIGKSETPVKGLRIDAKSVSPLKVDFSLAFVGEDQQNDDDTVIPFDGFDVLVDPASAPNVEEATVDFVDGLMGSGFKIEGPGAAAPELSGPVADKVQQILEDQVNPAVASHGGFVSLIDVKDNNVYLQLGGGCQGCGMADVTLKQGIEVMIKEAVPEIEGVFDVTDHAGGDNPYYQGSK